MTIQYFDAIFFSDIYSYHTHTSAAAPHVTGAAALLISEYPDEHHLQIKARILDNVDPVSSLTGKVLTGGRLNIYNAITATTPILSAAIEFDKERYLPGENAIVTVTDPAANIVDDALDFVIVKIVSDSDPGGIDVTLREISDDSGIFQSLIILTLTDESSGQRLRAAIGDDIMAHYGDLSDTALITLS